MMVPAIDVPWTPHWYWIVAPADFAMYSKVPEPVCCPESSPPTNTECGFVPVHTQRTTVPACAVSFAGPHALSEIVIVATGPGVAVAPVVVVAALPPKEPSPDKDPSPDFDDPPHDDRTLAPIARSAINAATIAKDCNL